MPPNAPAIVENVIASLEVSAGSSDPCADGGVCSLIEALLE
jgi:hypothetical protein